MIGKHIYQQNVNISVILDSLFDEIVILDKNYRIIDVNKTFCTKYGLSKEESIGKKCYKLTHGLNQICKPPECKCPVEEVIKTGTFSESIHAHYINGEKTYVELLAYPITNKKGKIKQIVKIGKDITEHKKIEQEIKESEEKLKLILSNINDSVIVISKDLKILYMNKKAEEEYGFHLIGSICYNVLMNKNEPCERCHFNKLINNEANNIRFENEFIDPLTYEKKHFDYSCTPISNFIGQPAIIGIIRDITDRKNIEEMFRNLVQNFPYSIILLDFNKQLYDCNSVAEIYLNLPKKELVNKDFFKIFNIKKTQRVSIFEIMQNIKNLDLSEITEFKFLNKDNDEIWVEAFFSSVKIGNKKYIQIILQDITERKLAENIIQEENERLRKLDQVKQKLTAQTSEELKSPLSIMSGASELLLTSYKDKLDQDAIKLLEMIRKGGERSMSLVEKIVDISRIESDTFELNLQTESLIDIIKESIDEISNRIENNKTILNLDLAEDLYSEVDKLSIQQVIKDLLLNALKNRQKTHEISISLYKNSSFAEISIKNTVSGLKEKKFNKKISQESLLGFHLSKEIVERHGGQILIDSVGSKEGSLFIIRLPIKDWRESLMHIYILYKHGLPLYSHSFLIEAENYDSIIVSGGIVGMITILKEIIKGEKQIRTIDHGDRNLMFKTNKTKDIIFALVVKENLKVFHKKLDILIEEFDKDYADLVRDIRNTCSVAANWKNLKFLVEKYFE